MRPKPDLGAFALAGAFLLFLGVILSSASLENAAAAPTTASSARRVDGGKAEVISFRNGTLALRPDRLAPVAQPTPTPRTATADELKTARTQWLASRHANTFDNGQGANTTCAQCKSPKNWDVNAPATEAAHDCSVCKREPGKPRPELVGGVPVSKDTWQSIGCDVCHVPVGNSYLTALAFWDQSQRKYEPMKTSAELCGKCHTEQHGFQVIYEQTNSPAHKGWDCTRCHGSHNAKVKCTDCHDPTQGRGVAAHLQHPNVNCTTCHDAGELSIWQDPYPNSVFYQEYMPQRFGHALRSWPSHNLRLEADCRRCHHPQGTLSTVVASNVRCGQQGCHPDGAVFYWCPTIPRDPAPKVPPR